MLQLQENFCEFLFNLITNISQKDLLKVLYWRGHWHLQVVRADWVVALGVVEIALLLNISLWNLFHLEFIL